ncbi:hypothetical protein PRIPAC_84130, partial [Pristionchus pacificus]|uniref:Uncharacterized protein n=1 Tax=Pristionchus pacificus TaxID=54126 RepID=A0A2A6BKW7_PRIPA
PGYARLDPAGDKQPAAAMRLATLASVRATPGCDSLLRVLRASRTFILVMSEHLRKALADPVGIVPREMLVGPRAIRKKMARDSQASLATLARQMTPESNGEYDEHKLGPI